MSTARAANLCEVLREPSVEAFTDFDCSYGVEEGKFIRISGMLLVAPLVKVGDGGVVARHLDMLWSGARHTDQGLADKVQSALREADPAKGLRERSDLMDVGYYMTGFTDSGLLATVFVGGDSLDFGRADETVRAETVDIMRSYVNDASVTVAGSGQL